MSDFEKISIKVKEANSEDNFTDISAISDLLDSVSVPEIIDESVSTKENFNNEEAQAIMYNTIAEDIPNIDDTPVIEEIPVVEDVPAIEDIPVVEDVPAIEDIPVVDDVPAVEDIPAIEDIPVVDDVPAIEDVPAVDDIQIATDNIENEDEIVSNIKTEIEETPIIEEPILDEPVLDESNTTESILEHTNNSNIPNMSVEQIVAEINKKDETHYDFTSCFELSIGENGGSYIAIHLDASLINQQLGCQAEGTIPVMFLGNCISIAYDSIITKKNLLTNEIKINNTKNEIITSINRSISVVAEINQKILDKKPELYTIISQLLNLNEESNVNYINEILKACNSRLQIVKDSDENLIVIDSNNIIHSLQEILWNLSL